MTVFSTRFVVLACLCATLPLALPAEAAHLHVSRSMEKHATSPHSPHATHTPSSFHGSTPAHKHNDEHSDHKEHEHKHERRLTRPPPLLRHYRGHDHNTAHHQSQDAHDRAGDKIPRSVFARSRHRRERTSHSSVYVPGEHGNTYIVSGTSNKHGEPGQASTDSYAHQRRQTPGNNLASGRIDIMSAAQSPSSTQRLASLAVDSTPIDWTSGQTSAKVFQLNASTTNRTQFVMVPTNNSDAAGKYVRLATPVFDAGSADTVMYCATYNANPGTPSALLMTPCADGAQLASSDDDAVGPCADGKDDVSSSTSQQSQIFSYDPFSGVIEPILSTEGSSNGNSSSSISASCAGAKVRRDTSNSTTSSFATPSSTSTNTAPTPNVSQNAQNVTLVYVAGALEVPAPSPSAGANSTSGSTAATPSAHMKQAAVVTTTVTTTVVTTVAASGTVSPLMADASVPTSSPATTTSGSSLSSSSTTSSGATTVTPVNAKESLEVEVVGMAPSTSTFAPTITTSSTSTSTTSSSSHSTFSTSLNAEAVASLVVEQMHHRSVIAIASASVV